MRRILTAIDLSARSDRAFERALALTRETRAELHILYVIDEDLPSRISTDLSHVDREDIAKRLSVRGEDGRADIHVEEGQPWDVIVRKARDLAADLIVVGTHKTRGVADLTLVHAHHIPFKGLTMRVDTEGNISKKQRDTIERPLVAQMARFVEALGTVQDRTTQTLRDGGATTVLEHEVLRNRADLLALGVHSRAPLVVGLLGGTATAVMSSPPCDVLLVPAHRQEAVAVTTE